jgi:chromosome partitioning protein
MKTIAVRGAKGGTLTSTTCLALGHLLALDGHEVVIVDADPQGTITRTCGLSRVPDPLTADVVTLDLAGTDGRIRLLPGGRALEAADGAQMDVHLARAADIEADVLLIDTPPTMGPIVQSAVGRADIVLVPCHTGRESLDGYSDVRTLAGELRPDLAVRAYIVLTHDWYRVCKWSQLAIETAYPGGLYPGVVVPLEAAAASAASMDLPVTAAVPRGRATAAYRKLLKAVARDLALGTPAALNPVRV